jgi:PAS domain S-box-containing protein
MRELPAVKVFDRAIPSAMERVVAFRGVGANLIVAVGTSLALALALAEFMFCIPNFSMMPSDPPLPSVAPRPAPPAKELASQAGRRRGGGTLSPEIAAEAAKLFLNGSCGLAHVWTSDETGNLNFLSESWLSFRGRTLEQELRDGYAEGVHPEDLARHQPRFAAAHRDCSTYEADYRAKGADGRWRWFRDRAVPRFDESGAFKGMVGISIDITAEKEAILALRESEAMYRATFEMSAVGQVQIDPRTGRYLKVNNQFAALLGRTAEEVQSLRIADVSVPEEWAVHQNIFRALVAGELKETKFRKHFVRKDGSRVLTEIFAAVIRDGEGKPLRLIGLVHDVSVQQAMEKALRESEAEYRATFEMAAVGQLQVNLADGCIMRANHAFAEMLGRTAEELQGMHLREITLPDHWDADADLINRIHTERIDRLTFCKRYHHKNGTFIWARVDSSIVRDADGRPLRSLSTVQDITAQRLAEDALQASEAEYRTTFELAAAGQAQADPSTGRYTRVNAKFAEMLGYSQTELVGMTIRDVTLPEDWESNRQLLEQLSRGEINQYTIEKRYLRCDKSSFWARVSASLLRDSAGQPLRAIAVIQDVSELKRVEAELRSFNETLEQRAAERSRVAEQRTDQLRRLASELNQAEHRERRRLAITLHDHLQQLLVAAQLRLAPMRNRTTDPNSAKSLQDAHDLIAQSIDVSRSLAIDLSPPVLQDRGLYGAFEWLARRMQEKHGLAVRLEGSHLTFRMQEDDALFVFRAAQELLFNVVKHAQCSEARLILEEQPESLQVTVVDHGCGFDPEALSCNEGADEHFGILSVKERLSLLGGSLQVESAIGHGTRVVITAPFAAPAADGPATRPARNRTVEAKSIPASSRPGAKLRVCLADDHKIVRAGFWALLEEDPEIEVVGEASDGVAAVALARKLRPDVMIMDVSMPGMTGEEATRAISAELPDVKVIGLSMHDEEDMAKAMLEAGAAGYFYKGGPAEDFIDAVFAAAGCRRANLPTAS